MINTIIFIVFLLVDISNVGIFAFIYSGKEKYCEGMILGVHIPKEEINHEDVQGIGNKYKKNCKKFNLWNLLLGTLVCLLCFWNFTVFIILWTIWLLASIVVGYGLVYVSHRKMYDVKMKHNWVMEGNTHIVYIDTAVSSMTKKLPISHLWNLPVVVGIGLLLLLPRMKEYFGTDPLRWILPVEVLFITVLLWGLHLWLMHRKNIVHSKDSSVNMAMNRMEKRTWSVILLSANYLTLLSWSYLSIMIMRNQWLSTTDYFIYIILQLISSIIIVFGAIYIQKKRKDVLSTDSSALVVDDDEYWKNGWYNNPNDTHLFVKDRMCSTNYSMNMAKPAAKTITVVTAVFLTVIIVGVFSLILWLNNSNITFQIDGNQVSIDAAMYDTKFKVSEIQSVVILDKIPEDDYTRTNGGATEKSLIGHFEGKATGKCMMYLYRDYSPVLEIMLADKIIYINSKVENEVQEWYQELNEILR